MKILILSAFLASCNGCVPAPVPVPLPPNPAPVVSDAGPTPPKPSHADAAPPKPSSPFELACANLARLACPEGKPTNCAAVLEHTQTSKLTPVDVSCLQAAPNAAAVRKCGVSCKGVP